jgi:hypothetical protein
MNFGELKTAVEDVLGRSDIPTIAYALMMEDAFRELRPRSAEVTVTLTSPYTLPVNFSTAVWVKYNDIALQSTEVFPDEQYSGTPIMFRVSEGKLAVWPDTTSDLDLRYLAAPDDLVNPADTNVILTLYPTVAVYGSLLQFARLTRDESAAAAYGPAYGEALSKAIRHEGKLAYSGGQIGIQPRLYP